MKRTVISKLGYALLGLLQQQPSSGYALRKIFSSTAMTTYSDSPGAIYPALQRLEQKGLIRGSIEQSSGLRRRQIFRLTPHGLAALKKWINRPLVRADVIRGLDEVMLRFAFSQQAVGAPGSVRLLKSLSIELTSYLPGLREQLTVNKEAMPTSGRLALESGLRSYECLLEWTKYALATYVRQEKMRQERKRIGATQS
ncbi:MAG TPA: PadR family transcriptional regulator [Candidatus Acidoferrum sp.]|jgi:DNA-binding PadR family transcriptional regulator|nr:PadR family transcriptional regulator [Candidatus Acidoferrum sp.]